MTQHEVILKADIDDERLEIVVRSTLQVMGCLLPVEVRVLTPSRRYDLLVK